MFALAGAIVKMRGKVLSVLKPDRAHIAGVGRKEVIVKSTFSAARHHLEEAHRLLPGDDELSLKSRQALEILIDAFLASEFSSDDEAGNVIDFSRRRRSKAG